MHPLLIAPSGSPSGLFPNDSSKTSPPKHRRMLLMTLTVFSLIASKSIGQLHTDITILQEDASSLTLEFTPRFIPQELKCVDGQSLSRTAFENEIVDDAGRDSAWIAYRGVPLQFPSSRAVVSVLSAKFRTVTEVPLPLPGTIRGKDFGLSPVYRSGPIGHIPPRDLACLRDVAPSLGKFMGTLRFYPVQYNVKKGEARLYTAIVVKVTFDSWQHPSMKTSAPVVGHVGKRFEPSFNRTKGLPSADSPLAEGTWYKMNIMKTGIYKIDLNVLKQAGISLSSIGDINSIRIFGNGGEMLPEDLTQSRPDGLEEVARFVVDNNRNGAFDEDDVVLFYGRSTRGWKYHPSSKSYSHVFSYYSESNYYFLTFGGAPGITMDTVASLNDFGAYTPSDFQEKVFVKQEIHNLMSESIAGGAGRQWVGKEFKFDDRSAVYTNSLPGFVSAAPVDYRFVFLSRSSTIDTFTVYESGTQLGQPILLYAPSTVILTGENASQCPWAWYAPETLMSGSGFISNNKSNVNVVFGTSNTGASGWMDYMDLLYRRSFDAVNGTLLFDSPDTSATLQYRIHNLPSGTTYVFDVTNHKSVKRITGTRSDAGTDVTFQVSQQAGRVNTYAVVGTSAPLTPDGIIRTANSNLHGQSPGSELVIVTPAAFLEEAERLATYRRSQDSLSVLVVDIDHVYNEFSGGLLDPTAIRDFLRYAVTHWQVRPRYALLIGGGHFDYKNILSGTPNWIPAYESLESNEQQLTYASDDFYVKLDAGSPRISIPIGRIPARTAEEAASAVDKIISYETDSPFDPWRNRITFVGDDGLASTKDEGDAHTRQAEELAEYHTPESYEKRKIYLSEYPTALGASGRTKPQVNRDIVAAVNRGTVILNFSGHGNSTQWTHEAVFTQSVDIPKLANKDKLSFVVAATCNFAEYDHPDAQSAGEQLVVMTQGGAIAEVAACREVGQPQNEYLNEVLYDCLFTKDSEGNPRRIGDVMWLTKQVCYGLNDLKYTYFGDPTTRLNVPRGMTSVDSVNKNSTLRMVSMQALGKVTVTGRLHHSDTTDWPEFNGTGTLEVFDSQQQVILKDINNFPVTKMGSILYRGQITVKDGIFRATIPIPKDVTYGGRSRVSFYACNSTTDAIGYTDSVTISGTDTSAVTDQSGPRVTVYLNDQSFRPGDRVKPNSELIVELESPNGINTSSAGIGHRLQATLNKSTTIDLTDYYRGDLDTYERGEIHYPLTDLQDGQYTLCVKAWDIRNTSSEAETYFTVSSSTDLEMANLVNYPNPFSRSTTFTFQRNSTDPIDVEVRIYSIAGRLVQSLQTYSITDRFVRIPWDGRDREGDPMANGVYLYKVIASYSDRRSTKEEVGKLVIMK